MAIVQISRIQHRRGRKQSGLGLPQLASGELGWAIDTQELYIGNGSVSEGAPYVGNTQILTEHTNLFDFVKTYAYKRSDGYIQTGSNQGMPVIRSLQDRLDDIVHARAFGANGDGSDQTQQLQRAIDQLYLNPANKGVPQSRVELVIDPGQYTISSTLYIPPFATIRGSGINKTIIENTSSNAVFTTVNEYSTIGNHDVESTNDFNLQARNINISGMTLKTSAGIDLKSCRDSSFADIEISGEWQAGNAVDVDSYGMRLSNFSSVITCKNNVFSNVSAKRLSYGVISDDDVNNNVFCDCTLDTLYKAVVFGKNTVLGTLGQQTGPQNNIFENSVFDNVYGSAITIHAGQYNISRNNRFYSVGNHSGTSANAKEPIIKFYTLSNQSLQDWFQRTNELSFDPTFLVNFPYVPEISGPSITKIGHTHQVKISEYGEYAKLIKLPADDVTAYSIDYIYKSPREEAYRSGTIELIVDPNKNEYAFSDDYEYIGERFFETALKFKAQTYDENNDNIVDTVAIMLINSVNDSTDPDVTSDAATLTFTVTSKS